MKPDLGVWIGTYVAQLGRNICDAALTKAKDALIAKMEAHGRRTLKDLGPRWRRALGGSATPSRPRRGKRSRS